VFKLWWHQYNIKTSWVFWGGGDFVKRNLQNCFTVDAGNGQHISENKHLHSSVCFFLLYGMFLCQCWQQSVHYCLQFLQTPLIIRINSERGVSRVDTVQRRTIFPFVLRTRIAKRFTNSSKQFRREVMFESEHTFFSWMHHDLTCQLLRNWRDQRPSN
jgi:hypothetical protein